MENYGFLSPESEAKNGMKVAHSDKDYVIPFVGLKVGMHTFEFDVTDKFFEGIEYSLIQKGSVKVILELEKRETMLVGNFKLEGTVESQCDRCTVPTNVEISGEYQLIYKFDDQPTDDESLIIVYPEEFEIDVKGNILELITVSLPTRVLHPEGECDEEMMEALSEYTVNLEDDDSDDWDDDDEDYDDPDDSDDGD